MNHLEELVAEWFAYCGYFVRRNINVGPRPRGGYECELDIVAYHPGQKRLVHVETSLDALKWEKRITRFARKFTLGRIYIPRMFDGVQLPDRIESIAVLMFAAKDRLRPIDECEVVHVSQLYAEILWGLRNRRVESRGVPEQFLLIRTIQQCYQLAWPPAVDLDKPDRIVFAAPALDTASTPVAV